MNMPMPIDQASGLDVHPDAEAASHLKRTLAISGGLVTVLIVLAALVPMGGAVIASGQVGVESRVKKIAHPQGGVIEQVAVANGQHVEKGELLLRFDNNVSGADQNYSNLTVEQLLAQRARLDAERLGAGQITFPPELLKAGTDSATRAMADEQRLFAIRRSEDNQMRAQLVARVTQYRESIVGLESQIASLQSQRKLIDPELQNVRELWDKQLVTISRLNQLERSAVDLEGSIGAQQAQVAQTRARITETEEQLIQMSATRRAQAGEDLAKINTTLNEQQLRHVSATDQNSRSEIRAPYSGTVEKIAFNAIGEVVRPAEPIMEIVPDHDTMVVEASVSPNDIDQVHRDQVARVRFSSFNRAATPEIDGKVVYVATDRTEAPENHAAFYTVRIEVDQNQLRHEGLALRSGMPAEVYIRTGRRSLLSYMTKPLADQIARAFKDN